MTEDFLHYLWKYQNFQFTPLTSTLGKNLEVINPGFHNHNSGPDFLEAVIQIDSELWAGNVEIHVQSADWFKHGHQKDPAYDNVILHVVYEHDRDVALSSGSIIEVLQLKRRFNELEYWKFEQLVQSQFSIPCSSQLGTIDPILIDKTLERAVCERMESRYSFIMNLLAINQNDWINTCYQLLAYGQGLKVNANAMLRLTQFIPYRILAREASDLTRLEALLLGCAGLLEEKDEYSKGLLNCYRFMKIKYKLTEMPRSVWKYSRLRPSSFPERRIAQLAGLIYQVRDLPRRLLDLEELNKLRELLEVDIQSGYWQTHYRLGIAGGRRSQSFRLTPEWVDKLLINVLIPMRFAYAKAKSETKGVENSFSWLNRISAEDNRTTRMMKNIGFRLETAGHTQGALHLYQSYCRPKKCLNCAIGIKILRSE